MNIDDPQIGKDVIESLTLGMYEDCRFIYREYIQNAADQIDKAVVQGLIKKGEEQIMVQIDPEKRRIVGEDNATGIDKDNVVPILRNIAFSTKKRGIDKGFRGIGRLGGLGYCSKLIFETSFVGEEVASIMVWDAELLKNIINDRDTRQEAVEVLKEVTEISTRPEKKSTHYFKVVLEDVTDDDLLDVESVRNYLEMVAPVEITSSFLYRSKINQFMKEHGLTCDVYNIYINQDQIFKPYTSKIYEDNKGGKKAVDEIYDVEFLLRKDDEGNIMYWGWYSISGLKGQMKPKNLARGLRLRKENIQIGDEEICKKFFSKTEDQRFSFYFFGEIHAVSSGLIPNSRRDYFSESATCKQFEKQIKQDFLNLRDLCYDASNYRTAQTTINKTEEIRQEIRKKEQEGFTSKKEQEELQQKLESQQKKAAEARKKLLRVQQKMADGKSPLLLHLDSITPASTTSSLSNGEKSKSDNGNQTDIYVPKKTKFRTDAPKYSRFSKQEKKLIGHIYESIKNYLPDAMSEPLITKIEDDLTK